MNGTVLALARSAEHNFSKQGEQELQLIAGQGVEGDVHAGKLVKHRSRVAIDPTQANLRQVHLLHSEFLEELGAEGFEVLPGALGENILTRGIDLLGLPVGTILSIGTTAELQVTGLRNPCRQIEAFQNGLLKHVAKRDAEGTIERLAGIMTTVLKNGRVHLGDRVTVHLPPPPHRKLEVV